MSIWFENNKQYSFFTNLFRGRRKAVQFIGTPGIVNRFCNGVRMGNAFIKSLLFSTDMAIIENNDSDAILAVYPFAPSIKIMTSLIKFAEKPVVCGIGGGLTQGKVALEMALKAESLGASAIIVNQPFKNKEIEMIKRKINIPVISSVSTLEFSFNDRINAGVDIFHITGGKSTIPILEHLNYSAPGYPVMATGGKNLDHVKQSILSGADAIVLTPPTTGELFRPIMNRYRKGLNYLKR